MSIIIAADTGGTFTDLAAFDRGKGRLVSAKSLTTYEDLVNGVMNCLHEAEIDLPHAEVVKFATTLVINTFVQRNGARTALLATEGHRAFPAGATERRRMCSSCGPGKHRSGY